MKQDKTDFFTLGIRKLFRSYVSFVLLGFLMLPITPVEAQVLTVEPNCGIAGDPFTIGGSGWAEPVPPCDYLFFFDGTTVAPDQPDGLFGPPNAAATVPAVPVGNYKVKVELRITEDGTLVQCRQTNFKVVDSITDPWMNNVTVNPPAFGAGVITAEFDPTNVCDVTPCTDIRLIQTIQQTGVKIDGSGTRVLSFAEQGFPDPDTATAVHEQDEEVTAAGHVIDTMWGANNPGYPHPAPGSPLSGVQNGTPTSASMGDKPGRPLSSFPADINKIILNFEINAFCAAGQNKGDFLGQVKWTWEQIPGGTPTATLVSQNRNAPSQQFLDALNKWADNPKHDPYDVPTMDPPTMGGEACN